MVQRKLIFALFVVSLALPLVGCNVGDTNPISPEMMEKQRQKEAGARGDFKPDETKPPANGG